MESSVFGEMRKNKQRERLGRGCLIPRSTAGVASQPRMSEPFQEGGRSLFRGQLRCRKTIGCWTSQH